MNEEQLARLLQSIDSSLARIAEALESQLQSTKERELADERAKRKGYHYH